MGNLKGSPVPQLNPELARMEHVFRSPPLTPKLVQAIRLIAPHYQINTDDRYRKAWESDQNAACWGEYLALQSVLESAPPRTRILDIGPGLGRSIVFFAKKFGWDPASIHAYEGDGTRTKYMLLGPRFEDSFCGNIRQLRYVLEYNGIRNVTVHDAKTLALAALPGPYDLIYSFYSIGFHWALDHFLNDILSLMADGGIAFFTVAPGFRAPAGIDAMRHTVVWSKSPLHGRPDTGILVLWKQ